MMTATTSATTAMLVPLQEYLHTMYHPDCDWVDGELRERNVGDFPHSSIQKLVMKFFLLREDVLGVSAYPELRLQVSSTNYRIPDILLLPLGITYENVVLDPPLLCVEVLSPDDRMSEVQERIDDYFAMGVSTVWVIDPRRRRAFLSDMAGQHPATELSLAGYDVHLQVADLFAQMDALAAKAR